MADATPNFIELDDPEHGRRRIASLSIPGRGDGRPGLIWLPGLKSDMASTKAEALAQWAATQGLALARFDYSGHGQSGGEFTEATIGLWLADTSGIFERLTQGPQIVIGSSMGGWIALRLLQELAAAGCADRIASLLLIAPAWDMTERLMWDQMPDAARREMQATERWLRPSAYSPEPYVITRKLIMEGRRHLLSHRALPKHCPIRIIHGLRDEDVPFDGSLELMQRLPGADIQISPVSDGEHRLSRPEDIALMIEVLNRLIEHFRSTRSTDHGIGS